MKLIKLSEAHNNIKETWVFRIILSNIRLIGYTKCKINSDGHLTILEQYPNPPFFSQIKEHIKYLDKNTVPTPKNVGDIFNLSNYQIVVGDRKLC